MSDSIDTEVSYTASETFTLDPLKMHACHKPTSRRQALTFHTLTRSSHIATPAHLFPKHWRMVCVCVWGSVCGEGWGGVGGGWLSLQEPETLSLANT